MISGTFRHNLGIFDVRVSFNRDIISSMSNLSSPPVDPTFDKNPKLGLAGVVE